MKTLSTERYGNQRDTWPSEGRHILAQFDESSVVVYQAFNKCIADVAVLNQRFGGGGFSFERMSWVKTNFLWMMYRCGWASKKNQERVLAIRISREGFEEILSNAYSAYVQKQEGLQTSEIQVRLQWDPDHTPTYDKLPRRAIQLGLKGEILRKYATEWIEQIEDVTDFVVEQKQVLDAHGADNILVAKETVYPLQNPGTIEKLGLDCV
ncbi:hypothetical protein CAPTEDRAFT_138895 [Capitella teleta]|uniref:DUF4291 domain-containing protein n=1 Tax=Capitella teleta TaxID=283909 RepID=R7TNW5_CAPTE|nr:hypothetical protein CAPTEDRAFT_138895 [Capitella teleta]|eukprot:ELT92750.1 hypothetical protein CAPTEDRAFT_138895 [Capitella teleta]